MQEYMCIICDKLYKGDGKKHHDIDCEGMKKVKHWVINYSKHDPSNVIPKSPLHVTGIVVISLNNGYPEFFDVLLQKWIRLNMSDYIQIITDKELNVMICDENKLYDKIMRDFMELNKKIFGKQGVYSQ
jgi:hypothetical protein